MEPTKKAARDALKFMASAVNDPDMPPETRRKCAEMILARIASDERESVAAAEVNVTYQVLE